MCTLNNVIIIGNAQAVLPIVGVGISKLVILAASLIRYVEHACEVGDHLVLLESDGNHLCVIGV